MGLRVCKPLSKFGNSFLQVLVRIRVPGALRLGHRGSNNALVNLEMSFLVGGVYESWQDAARCSECMNPKP